MNLRQLHCARLIPAVVAVVLAASVALPGQAAGADGRRVAGVVDRLARAADPVAAYPELSLEDQAAVRQFLTAVSVSDTSTLSVQPSTSGGAVTASIICWTWTWQRDGKNFYGKNFFGYTLWSHFQRIDWCGNGSTITSTPHGVQRTRWGEVYYPFWQWRHIGSETWGGVGQQTYRAWTQAEFKYCVVPDIGCQYVYPWLDMTAWADGRGTGSVG